MFNFNVLCFNFFTEMPQCESCKIRGIRYRCKKCIKYFFELIPKTKYNELNIEKGKTDKFKKKNKKNNKNIKSEKNVGKKCIKKENDIKEMTLEFEKSDQGKFEQSDIEKNIESQINDYIKDISPYGYYGVY